MNPLVQPSPVTNISREGFWLLVADREYFAAFAHYPEFSQASVAQIYHARRLGANQVTWPELDLDIDLGALAEPSRFPLVYR